VWKTSVFDQRNTLRKTLKMIYNFSSKKFPKPNFFEIDKTLKNK